MSQFDKFCDFSRKKCKIPIDEFPYSWPRVICIWQKGFLRKRCSIWCLCTLPRALRVSFTLPLAEFRYLRIFTRIRSHFVGFQVWYQLQTLGEVDEHPHLTLLTLPQLQIDYISFCTKRKIIFVDENHYFIGRLT